MECTARRPIGVRTSDSERKAPSSATPRIVLASNSALYKASITHCQEQMSRVWSQLTAFRQ
jgi:hypothetical protein